MKPEEARKELNKLAAELVVAREDAAQAMRHYEERFRGILERMDRLYLELDDKLEG